MAFISKNRLLVVLIVIFIGLLGFYVVREYIASKHIYKPAYSENDKYNMVPKVYGVNEYSIVNISDEYMSKVYLIDYVNQLRTDMTAAYNLLNKEYRDKKFGSVSAFQDYINKSHYSNTLSKYYSEIIGGHNVYGAYDSYNNLYIFKTDGVLQYEVYLDDYTVEI